MAKRVLRNTELSNLCQNLQTYVVKILTRINCLFVCYRALTSVEATSVDTGIFSTVVSYSSDSVLSDVVINLRNDALDNIGLLRLGKLI